MNLTQATVLKIKNPEQQQKLYYDDQLKGFGLRITKSGTKSYFVEKKNKRITIGRANEIDISQARNEAKKILGKIALGISLIEKKDDESSLIDVYGIYLSSRKNLSPVSIYNYNRHMNIHLREWHNISLVDITNKMVSKKHTQLGTKYNQSTANQTMRLLKSIFNFYIAINEHVNIRNPVNVLTHTKSWYKINVRKSYIKDDQLLPWYQAVNQCRDTLRDYLIFILHTGLRRSEAAKLTWEQINFKSMTFVIIDTKNKEMHELPLTRYLYQLLMTRDKSTHYVFPGGGSSGHIIDPKKSMKRIIDESGVEFTIHDLRRTFATIADRLDVPGYALKRLLNHKSSEDVTSGYIGVDVERLRDPMEKISDFIRNRMGLI